MKLACVLLAVLVSTGQAAETIAPVTLTAVADKVSLATDDHIQVMIKAAISTPLAAIRLSSFTDAGVSISIANDERTKSPLSGDIAWDVTILPLRGGRFTGKIIFRADYTLQPQSTQQTPVPGVTTVAIDVQERPPETINSVISAVIETSVETLQDGEAGRMFVIVKNVSNVPIKVSRLFAKPVPYANVDVEKNAQGDLLTPRQVAAYVVTVTADKQVAPGKSLLVLELDAEWEQEGHPAHGTIVLSKGFEMGVFGQSAILTATAIPSILVLPGFLFLCFFLYVLKKSFEWTPIEFDLKSPQFLALAVTLSLVASWVYPMVSVYLPASLAAGPQASHTYLRVYGFEYIRSLWITSVLAGLITGALCYLVKLLVLAWKFFRDRRTWNRRLVTVPRATDSPFNTLTKIVANGRDFNGVPARTYTHDGQTQTVWLLPLPNEFSEPGKFWVAPRICLRHLTEDNASEFDRWEGDAGRRWDQIIENLDQWIQHGVRADWEQGALIGEPTLVLGAELTRSDTTDPFITTE